jgi:hypothetical protein
MKKVIAGFGVALALFSYTSTKAQLVVGGVKGGINYAKIEGLNENSESEINPTGGIFLQYGAKPHLKYGIEFLYSPKSTSYNILATDSVTKITKDLKYEVKFSYIDVPILVSYNFFGDSAKFRPRVYAGPNFGIRLNANSNLKFSYSNDKDSVLSSGEVDNENIGYSYSPVDVGLAVGLGANYMITDNLYALVDLRYVRSIADLNENPNASVAVRNMNIAVHAGIAMRLGKKAKAAAPASTSTPADNTTPAPAPTNP